MATGKSGTFELTGSKNMTMKVAWGETYDVATNKSVASITNLQLKSEYHGGCFYLDGTIKIDGVTAITFESRIGNHYIYCLGQKGYSAVVSQDDAPPWKVSGIEHDSDGSKAVSITVDVHGYTVDENSGNGWHVSASKNVTLTTIPRASAITSAGDVTLGNKCSVKWTPKAAAFLYKLKFSLGDWSYTTGAIHPNQTSAYTYTGYTIPLAVAEQITGAKTGTMTVKLYTYSGSGATDQVGDADSATFTVTVPDNDSTKPAVTMTLAPVSSLADAFDGLYIQGKTKVKATLSATGKYDATIKSYSMKVDGTTYDSGDDYTSDYLANAGSITVNGYAKDSRGITGSTSKKITVIAYSKPKIVAASGESEVIAARCDADGNLSDSGTYLKIKAKRSYSPVNSGGVQHNFCKIRYRYKLESAASYSSWTTILAGDSMDGDEIVTGALLGGVLAVDSTYLVQVQAIDDIGEYGYTTISVPTDKVYMHRDKIRRALAFGMYIQEDNCIDIAEDIKVRIRGPFEALFASTAEESDGNTVDYLKLGARITATAAAPVSLNKFKTPGNYYSPNAENSKYITDSPNTESGFGLIVREMQNSNYIRQELYYGRTTWIRHWNGEEWSDWWRYLTTTVAETAAADYVVETGVKGGWTYKKWKGGTYEMFGTFEVTPPDSTLRETLYRTDNMTIDVPFEISSATVTGTAVGYYWITNGGISGTSKITLRLMSDREFDTATAIEVRLSVVGTYT